MTVEPEAEQDVALGNRDGPPPLQPTPPDRAPCRSQPARLAWPHSVRGLELLGLAAAAVALTATQAAAGRSVAPLVGSAGQANSVRFADSTGENPGGPDITGVVASNNDAGAISFEILLPNRSTLPPEMLIELDIDSDNNAATGDPQTDGADYAVEFFGGQANLFKWDGTNFTRRAGDPPQVSLVTSATPSSLTITINASELGGTRKLRFGLFVVTGIVVNQQTGDLDGTNARVDAAPDFGHGLYTYDVRTAPLRLVARRFTAPAARAGRPYTARLVAARSDTGATLSGGTVSCTATAGGRRLAVRSRGFVGTAARCTWVIPAAARGSTIRGTVTVRFEGLRVSRSFSRPIR